jgi:serine/threonine protein kinase
MTPSASDPDTPNAGPEAAAPPSDAADRSRSGTGFDTLLGRALVERGFVSAEELQECLRAIAEQTPPPSLSELLIRDRLLTERQLQRIRTDMESDRASQHIPGYRIIKKLGAGAMATVYLAKQVSLDRLVAIKLLPRRFSSDAKFIDRFYREGRAAARFNDQNIVAAYDVGQSGEQHYFVMEYVDGETVHDRIVREGRIAEADAIAIVRQVASALKHAHAKGFIHRDIKPKNIMLGSSGVVKLADLGLARALSDRESAEAEAGKAYGTPYYISPEQIRGLREIGPAADLYGLGATLYHMVTGRVPFPGKSPNEVMNRHLKAPLVPPDHVNPQLSSGVALVIEAMLAKDPSERYGDAGALLEDLDRVAAGEPPTHARGHDIVSVVAAAAAASAVGEAPRGPVRNEATATASPLLLGLLAASVLANLVLLVVLLLK